MSENGKNKTMTEKRNGIAGKYHTGKPAAGKSAERLHSGKPAERLDSGKKPNRLHSGKPAERLDSGKKPERLHSGKPAERLDSGKKPDRLHSGKPAERLDSGKKPERLHSGKPAERLDSGKKPERLHSGKPAERLDSGKKPDHLHSGKPAERLNSGKKPNRLHSGKPAERLDSGKKPERLHSGKPAERLDSGKKQERLHSGKPAERLHSGKKPERLHSGDSRKGPYGRPALQKSKLEEMEGLAARRMALKVLREVTEEGAYASLSLDRVLTGSGIGGADRRLVSRLVYDTLDHLGYLDHMLSQVMAREDTDIKLKNILRLGACQILLEDRIPESAATNTCVQLCTELGMEGLKGVCNGILRNLVRKKDELTLPDPETEPEEYFAVKYSVPKWLGERLCRDWGGEEAVRIVSWREPESAITIRRNLLKTSEKSFEEILEKKIWGRKRTELPDAWRITGAMDIARDSDFLAGNFSILSESSMMVCLALSPRRGSLVLDCCAAPGGKTCYLSELMGDTGRIQAWDVHSHRVQLVAAQQKRLGLENIRPIERDARKYREDLDTRADAVLLDAPCSGLGVLAEKPDIKLRVTEEGLLELIRTQAELMDTVCRYVRPGGVLVYSTCSVLKDENENQVRAFLAKHPEFEAEALPESIPEKYRAHQDLGLQLLPHRDGVEGFYLCRMRRKDTI